MGRKRSQLGWLYNAEREEFLTPSGRTVSLVEIAGRLYDDVTNTHDLAGSWRGWRLRGDVLKGPDGLKINARGLRVLLDRERRKVDRG